MPTLINRDEEVVKTSEERPEEDEEDKHPQDKDTTSGNITIRNLQKDPLKKVNY